MGYGVKPTPVYTSLLGLAQELRGFRFLAHLSLLEWDVRTPSLQSLKFEEARNDGLCILIPLDTAHHKVVEDVMVINGGIPKHPLSKAARVVN